MVEKEEKKKNIVIKLRVAEALPDDAYKGIARIDDSLMRKLNLDRGDIILIKGDRETYSIVDHSYPADRGEEMIRIDGISRKNAKTSIGDQVTIQKAVIKEAKQITIAPAQQGIVVQVQGDPDNLRRGLLGKPVTKGDIVVLGGAQRRRDLMSDGFGLFGGDFEDIFNQMGLGGMSGGISPIRFSVVSTSPNQPVLITENTKISLNPKAVELSEESIPQITYEDIGGLRDEVKKVREMVELPLKRPEIFSRLGIEPPKGVLLYGPPGTGKTLLARAVANESDAHFILLNGPEIMSKFYGESEKKIREIFEDAEKNAPSIIFIDEIDSLAPKREDSQGEVERRVVSQLLTMMDGLKSRGKVVVIGATNRPNALDPALRRPGRFDREVEISVPDKQGRLSILNIHTRNMPLDPPFNLEIAERVIKQKVKEIDESKPQNRLNILNSLIQEQKDETLKITKKLKEIGKEEAEATKDLTLLELKKKELRKKLRENDGDFYSDKLTSSLNNLERQELALSSHLESLAKKRESYEKSLKENGKVTLNYGKEIAELTKQITLPNKFNNSKKLPKENIEESLYGLSEESLIKIMDIYFDNFSNKELIVAKEDLLSYLRGEFLGFSDDPRVMVLDNYAKQFKLTKEFITKKIIPQLKDKEDEGLSNYLISIVKYFDQEDLTKEIFYESVDESLKNQIKQESLEKMKEILAAKTHGFVGADISALTKEAAMIVLRRNIHKFNLEEDKEVPQEVLNQLKVSQDDFQEALKVVRPSAMREVFIETPNTKWNDIGGVEEVKQDLKEAVEWPLKFPESFIRMGIRPPKGVLLYGPPGTGKTLLAKAVANESESNFIQVKGPELLSMWVGKSEEGVRKIFERARQVSPCVIFFDEIDALAGRRGGGFSGGSKVTENVLNQILAEMDGIEGLNNVIVIGATNRPDILDPALMRPGRFDRIVYVPVPNKEGRLQILKIHTKNMPLDKSVDVENLAEETDGYTGADLESLCREAAMLALRENIEVKQVTKKHFEKAFEKVSPSVSKSDAERYKQVEQKYLRSARSALPDISASYAG